MKLVVPYHYRVYERENLKWFVIDPSQVFYSSTNKPIDLKNIEERFGLTPFQVIAEFLLINGGIPGFYLADLKNKKYYYCGSTAENIKRKLLELGIGREDPIL